MRELVVALRRASDETTRARAHAYWVAVLTRADKPPTFEDWLSPRPAQRRQTRAQQRAVFDQLSATLGIPLRRTRLVPTRGGDPDAVR